SSGVAGSASPGARPAAARRAASADRGRQPFPCLLQPALEYTRRPAKLMSGLISGETFQVAQHERDAALVREPNQLPVQNLVRFPQGDLSEEGGNYAYWTSRPGTGRVRADSGRLRGRVPCRWGTGRRWRRGGYRPRATVSRRARASAEHATSTSAVTGALA